MSSGWNGVDRIQRNDTSVGVINNTIVPIVLMMRGMCGEVTMYEDVGVAVIVGFVSVLRRGDWKESNRQHKHGAERARRDHHGNPSARAGRSSTEVSLTRSSGYTDLGR